METIKLFFEQIGIVENEKTIVDFLESHKDKIKSLWEEQFTQPTTIIDSQQAETAGAETEQPEIAEEAPEETAPDTQADDASTANEQATDNQPHTDMSNLFGTGEKPDQEKTRDEALAFQIKNKQITFQNGKVNQEYCIDFDIDALDIQDIESVSFEGLETIGLQYYPSEKKIKGTPSDAGDHKITMKFKIKGYENRPPLERSVIFIINPDPRVLWSKNIPTPEDIDYYKPDSDQESKYSGLKKKGMSHKNMIAASQRGRSHAIEGKPRDDDFVLYFDEQTEWYIMAVADGAGSAKYSRKGSQIACRTAKEVCSKQLSKDGISDMLDMAIGEYHKENSEKSRSDLYKALHSEALAKAAWEAYNNIRKEVPEKQAVLKDYATTLILSICKKFEFGWFVAAWWVGDGGIGIYGKESQLLKILGEPDGGEFAGQTRFLTMPEIFSDRVRTRFEIVKDFTAIVLMTDGVTDPKFETDANLNRIEKWHAIWDDLNGNNEDNAKVDFADNNENAAGQLLKWLDFWSKGNHDDRTIAILF